TLCVPHPYLAADSGRPDKDPPSEDPLPLRFLTLAVGLLAMMGPAPVVADALLPLVTPVVAVPGDSLAPTPTWGSVPRPGAPAARPGLSGPPGAASQAAWTRREEKTSGAPVRPADLALRGVAVALPGARAAPTRRELVDVQSKLIGLRDA